jgi:heat shock protein HtpX
MAHILNGDMVTLTLIQGVMNTFVYFISHIAARFISSFLSRGEESSEGMNTFIYHAIAFVAQIIFGFLAMFVVMWFSRIREYRADLGGAQYTSKAAMIAGLKKLQKITQKLEPQENGKMTAFMITEKDSFFSTHPSLQNRIEALESNYQLA